MQDGTADPLLSTRLALGLLATRPAVVDLGRVIVVQATSSKLQRSELSVNAAQLELDNLKAHVREQDDVIVGLHEQLQANQALLGTISRAANQHAKPIGDPQLHYTLLLELQTGFTAWRVTMMLELSISDQISRHIATHLLLRCCRAISSCQGKPFWPQERVGDQEEPCA